jgi:NAD(P)-dependent dehydrogenase (short-subunit alcohol dehydrogenase family)
MTQPLNWTPDAIADLTGRTMLITGANSGLGLESTRMLAGRGARVVMACRNLDKGRQAMDEVRAAYPDAELDLMELDLADLNSVRAFAQAFRQHYEKLDVLMNNGGIMAPPLAHTKDGFEMQLGVNHLAHFALTGLLLDQLEAAPDPRIVLISSFAHRMGNIYFDNLNAEKWYKRWKFYGQSKLANLMHALELDRRLRAEGSSIRAVPVHPGYSATGLQRTVAGGGFFNALFAQSQTQGAYPQVFAATSERAEAGQYYGPHGFMEFWGYPTEVGMRKLAKNEAVADQLWTVSAEMTGVDYLALDGP